MMRQWDTFLTDCINSVSTMHSQNRVHTRELLSSLVRAMGSFLTGSPLSPVPPRLCSGHAGAMTALMKTSVAPLQSAEPNFMSEWTRSRQRVMSLKASARRDCGATMNSEHAALRNANRVVVKVGSSSVSGDQADQISSLVDVLVTLQRQGTQVVLVSSGAISTGVPFL